MFLNSFDIYTLECCELNNLSNIDYWLNSSKFIVKKNIIYNLEDCELKDIINNVKCWLLNI